MRLSATPHWILLTLVLILSAVPARADTMGKSYFIEQAQQRYFDSWDQARLHALGGAATSTNTEVNAVSGNPAGLGRLASPEMAGGYNYNQVGGKEGISEYQHIGTLFFGLPLSPTNGAIAFGVSTLQGGPSDFPVNSEHRDLVFHAGYGLALSDSLAVGYALGWFRNSMYSNLYEFEMNHGFRHTLGLQYQHGEPENGVFELGLQGFFGHTRYRGDLLSERFPSASYTEIGGELGTAFHSPLLFGHQASVFFATDYASYQANGDNSTRPFEFPFMGDESGHRVAPKLGVEIPLQEAVTLRAGTRYQWRHHFFARDELRSIRGDADAFVWTVGLGFSIPSLSNARFDASLEERSTGRGNRHMAVALVLPL